MPTTAINHVPQSLLNGYRLHCPKSLREVSGVLAWAIRIIALWGAIGTVGYLLLDEWTNGPESLAHIEQDAPPTSSALEGRLSQTFRADPSGHYFLKADVNGANIRFIVDTGATLVSLSANDAEAAGFDLRRLDYSHRSQTANGVARVARVQIRELRIGPAVFRDVDASVREKPGVSLLGMALLSRLQSYEIRDGKLTLWW